jgi:hypothetical protein
MPPNKFLRVFHLLLGTVTARMMGIVIPHTGVSPPIFDNPSNNPPRLPDR